MAIFKKQSKKAAEEKTVEIKKETTTKRGFSKHFTKNILLKPWVTEKSTDLSAEHKYVFLVEKDATKPLVKENVSRRYNVTVDHVDMVRLEGKMKYFRNKGSRRPPRKKAIVTLKKGEKIDIQ